mgnify:CR=1 FL=1
MGVCDVTHNGEGVRTCGLLEQSLMEETQMNQISLVRCIERTRRQTPAPLNAYTFARITPQ